jgi:hypothetical protein
MTLKRHLLGGGYSSLTQYQKKNRFSPVSEAKRSNKERVYSVAIAIKLTDNPIPTPMSNVAATP